MIYTSLAVLAMSAATAISPGSLSSVVHFHPHSSHADTRISFTLVNNATRIREIRVSGQSYTVAPHHTLSIKAPIGTPVYADSRTPLFQRGDVMLEVNPKLDHTRIELD